MKYGIDGIEKGETIISHGKSDKEVLEVRYQDNSYDYFPAKKEIVERVNNVMEDQATIYVNSGRATELSKRKLGYTVISAVTGGGALASTPDIVAGFISSNPDIITTGVAVAAVGIATFSLIKRASAKKELDYIRKLRMYLENKDLITSKYSLIKEREDSLGMDTGFKKIDINNIDRVPSDAVEEAINKCKRYPVIDNTPFQKHL